MVGDQHRGVPSGPRPVVGDQLLHHGGRLLTRLDGQPPDRDLRHAVLIQVPKPVIRGGLQVQRIHELGGYQVHVPHAHKVARIEARVPGQQEKARGARPLAMRLLEERAQGPGALRSKVELVVEILHVNQGHRQALRLPPELEVDEAGEQARMGQDHQVRPMAAHVPLGGVIEVQRCGPRLTPFREGEQGPVARPGGDYRDGIAAPIPLHPPFHRQHCVRLGDVHHADLRAAEAADRDLLAAVRGRFEDIPLRLVEMPIGQAHDGHNAIIHVAPVGHQREAVRAGLEIGLRQADRGGDWGLAAPGDRPDGTPVELHHDVVRHVRHALERHLNPGLARRRRVELRHEQVLIYRLGGDERPEEVVRLAIEDGGPIVEPRPPVQRRGEAEGREGARLPARGPAYALAGLGARHQPVGARVGPGRV